MPASRIRERLDRMAARLSAQVIIADAAEPMLTGGYLKKELPESGLTIYIPAETPGALDILTLMASVDSVETAPETAEDICRNLLKGRLAGDELAAVGKAYQLPRKGQRCVLVFRIKRPGSVPAGDVLAAVIPMQEQDRLIGMDALHAALIKDMTGEFSREEVLQFAQALQDTLANDTDCDVTIGIGCLCSKLEDLPESYSQARRAVELGLQFSPEENIFEYEGQVLERFLTEIPEELRQKYSAMLSEKLSDQKVFTEEMMHTIDMFLRADLNIAEAARRLYTHRNTLIYRLNSVQRATGLDLRSFRDAMIFKILMDMGKTRNPSAK